VRVFENRVLRRIFAPKREEVTRKWRELNNVDFNDPYFSPNIIRMIKSKTTKLARYAAGTRESGKQGFCGET